MPNKEKNIKTRGFYMDFEAYEGSKLTHFSLYQGVIYRVRSLLKYRISLIFCFLDEFKMAVCSSSSCSS